MNLNQQYNVTSVEEINAQVENYIGETVQELLEKVANADNLLEQENFERLMQEINNILNQMGVTLQDVVPEQTLLNYFGAVDDATVLLQEAGVAIESTAALTASGQVTKGFQRKIHIEAVESLVTDTMMDMNAAIRSAKNSANKAIAQTLESVKSDIAKGLILGDHSKATSKRVMESFLKDGMTSFVTKDGKSLPLDFYARTVTRTKSREANTLGHINRYTDAGVGLVQIDGRTDTCPVCASYRGMVVSLTGKHEGFRSTDTVELCPFHQNCRCVVRPYVEEYKTEDEMEEQRKKWRSWDKDKDTRTPAQKKEYERQQKIRRQANEEKKQYMRYVSTLGAEAPRSLGAFRRMKRENSPRYQELVSMYRSVAQQSS